MIDVLLRPFWLSPLFQQNQTIPFFFIVQKEEEFVVVSVYAWTSRYYTHIRSQALSQLISRID